MKTGDAILYRKKGIIGNLIGIFSKSKFSHVSIVVVLNKIPFVIEADGRKDDVIIQDLQSSTKGRKYVVKSLKKPLRGESSFIDDLKEWSELEYGYKTLFRHIYKKRFKEDNKEVICSQLGVLIYEAYHDLVDVVSNEFTPEDYNSNPILTNLFKEE